MIAARLRLPLLPQPQALPTELIDSRLRRVSYLRVSLTDRCNYRCTYCMPEDGVALAPRSESLTSDELVAVIAALRSAGLRRVRITGGEPTVYPDLVPLVARLAALGLDDLALSTNGERLAELAAPLRRAGLSRLNVSVDSLDEARFQQVTRRGHLPRVIDGLRAARAAGFLQTKINTVAMRGFNDDELPALCRFAWQHGFVPRFIELMPMAEGSLFYPGTFLPAAAMRDALQGAFGAPLASSSADGIPPVIPGVGPARYLRFRHADGVYPVGIISAVTEPFCDTCNRVRLSATGHLQACLGHDDAVALRPLISQGRGAILAAVRDALEHKAAGHEFQASGCGGPRRHMVSIGG